MQTKERDRFLTAVAERIEHQAEKHRLTLGVFSLAKDIMTRRGVKVSKSSGHWTIPPRHFNFKNGKELDLFIETEADERFKLNGPYLIKGVVSNNNGLHAVLPIYTIKDGSVVLNIRGEEATFEELQEAHKLLLLCA